MSISRMSAMQTIMTEHVRKYIYDKLEKTDEVPVFHVYVVWYSKTLQNAKALISTTLPDGMYYELTYNGDQEELYLDAYKKFENQKFSLR